MKIHRILILDGGHKNALAIVRHLGVTGHYEIDVAAHKKLSISLFSKYVFQKHLVSNPRKDPDKYVEEIIGIIKQKNYLTLMPVSYISFALCSKNKERISKYTHLTIASFNQINIASSKIATYHLAEKIGVPYPNILKLSRVEEIEHIEFTYPCVIKAPVEVGKNVVEYAHNKSELVRKYKRMVVENNFEDALPIVQKYVCGDGAGFFAFYKNGICKNYFMHQRIREYPVTGGASVVAKRFHNKQIEEDGKRILNELKWEGVAMVEFKKDNDTGIYNLMEINAKFWGSLELALICGANFPKMLINDALGKTTHDVQYKNETFQWILNGDLFHLLERPHQVFSFIKYLFISKNDIWLTDIKPNLYQLAFIPFHYYKKWLH